VQGVRSVFGDEQCFQYSLCRQTDLKVLVVLVELLLLLLVVVVVVVMAFEKQEPMALLLLLPGTRMQESAGQYHHCS
jgi:hypothetical protein